MARKAKQLIEAVAYMRTSSSTNVGTDKDSEKRQRAAIDSYAKSAGYDIIAEYADEDVKGDLTVDQRPGFAEMMKHIAGNGVRTIIVETASRFARDLIVQETGWRYLRDAGINLIAADSPEAFLDETPTAVMIRQILGSVSQFEKAMLVAKLKGARDRKKATTGKCGGRKTYAERGTERDRAMLAKAKELSEQRPRLSLRQISAALKEAGYITPKGNPYAPSAVASMLAGALDAAA